MNKGAGTSAKTRLAAETNAGARAGAKTETKMRGGAGSEDGGSICKPKVLQALRALLLDAGKMMEGSGICLPMALASCQPKLAPKDATREEAPRCLHTTGMAKKSEEVMAGAGGSNCELEAALRASDVTCTCLS